MTVEMNLGQQVAQCNTHDRTYPERLSAAYCISLCRPQKAYSPACQERAERAQYNNTDVDCYCSAMADPRNPHQAEDGKSIQGFVE